MSSYRYGVIAFILRPFVPNLDWSPGQLRGDIKIDFALMGSLEATPNCRQFIVPPL